MIKRYCDYCEKYISEFGPRYRAVFSHLMGSKLDGPEWPQDICDRCYLELEKLAENIKNSKDA